MKLLLTGVLLIIATGWSLAAPEKGEASWYGETHRGRLMADGKKFNPDRLTAASWFYPLGSRVEVTVRSPGMPRRTVTVRITDRGPAERLVKSGRIIDLSRAAFAQLDSPHKGLVSVSVRRLE